MADDPNRNRFIPFRKADIVAMCCDGSGLKALSDNLYFKNLDNNTGVFHHLIDAAKEEEVKEAVLAYFFLLKENRPMEKGELDDLIENWFEDRWNCRINFEIDDALKKLERLELVTREGNILQCHPLAEAKRQLDHIWDNFFTYNRRITNESL